jgi:hypothetical protein
LKIRSLPMIETHVIRESHTCCVSSMHVCAGFEART